MEFDGDIDLRSFDAFRRGFSSHSQKAFVYAVKGESFRLRSATNSALIKGVGPAKAKLTQVEAKNPGPAALSAFGTNRFIAYRVEETADGVESVIGFSQWISRAKSASGRKKTIVSALSGGPRTITRREQATIARRVRRRLGEPVARTRNDGTRRKPKRPARYEWADLALMLPPVGAVVDWPQRDVVTQVVKAEREKTVRNIKLLYEFKLRGGRWAGGAWWEQAPFRDLA